MEDAAVSPIWVAAKQDHFAKVSYFGKVFYDHYEKENALCRQ